MGPLLALAVVLGIGLVQHAIYLPRMPAHMATHFDAGGRPNGFMTGSGMLLFEAFVLAIVVGSFILPVLLVRYGPAQAINVPNKEYWFAPERREASRATIIRYLLWMLPITVGFLVAVDELVFRANLEGGSLSGAGLAFLIVGFILAMGVVVIQLLRAFALPQGAGR